MRPGRFRIFTRRRGQDARAWPLLALLLLVVLAAVGCVLWFMREAMRNERLAVRGKLEEAYRGQLAFLRGQSLERWRSLLRPFDSVEAPAAKFAHCAAEGEASSLICLDEHGGRAYPREPQPPPAGPSVEGEAWQSRLRELVRDGKKEEAVQFVIDRSAKGDAGLDAQGRLLSANAELLALELLPGKDDPRFGRIAAALRARITDYTSDLPPSGQRLFIMRALERLDPSNKFPLLPAEDLAARYLETNPALPAGTAPGPTELRDVWAALSPGRRAVVLFTTGRLRSWIGGAMRGGALPEGVRITALAPGEEPLGDPAPVMATLAPELPGWRFSLALDDRSLLNAEAASWLKLHAFVACGVIAAMTGLGFLIARGLGRQVALARIKNDLVATVSHELKTPLTAMRALVETLLETEELDAKTRREYLQLLAAENARLSRLIDNFLTFSRLERNKLAFDFKGVAPGAVVAGALAALGERGHAPGCRIESHVPADLPAVAGDLDALTTALLNLLDNAWKYSGEEKRIIVSGEARDGKVRLSVEDNGIGLSPEESRRVFHRFYQVDHRLSRSGGGCGLGLSIVQSIAEAHGGRVEAASEPGRGSVFTIEIPTASAAHA